MVNSAINFLNLCTCFQGERNDDELGGIRRGVHVSTNCKPHQIQEMLSVVINEPTLSSSLLLLLWLKDRDLIRVLE